MSCEFCKGVFSYDDCNKDLTSYSIEFNGVEVGGSYVLIDDDGNGDPVLRNLIYFGDIADADSECIKINYCPVCGRELKEKEKSE